MPVTSFGGLFAVGNKEKQGKKTKKVKEETETTRKTAAILWLSLRAIFNYKLGIFLDVCLFLGPPSKVTATYIHVALVRFLFLAPYRAIVQCYQENSDHGQVHILGMFCLLRRDAGFCESPLAKPPFLPILDLSGAPQRGCRMGAVSVHDTKGIVFFVQGSDPGFPLQNTKSPPPRKSPKITQKLQFGPPRDCPENYQKITKKCNFLLIYY